ncbi:MAG TPA: hypothetical protein VGQ24_09685 [Gemmatimonadales bacterium]|nr:hypothetical protein [Gemmatimonadales bacterium]
MSDLAHNLALGPVILVPASAAGAQWWAVYERLDRGAVIHGRYLGLLVGVPGEPAETTLERAAALAAGG